MTALVVAHAVMTLCVFVVLATAASALEDPILARLAFAAPGWPVALVALLVWGVWEGLRWLLGVGRLAFMEQVTPVDPAVAKFAALRAELEQDSAFAAALEQIERPDEGGA